MCNWCSATRSCQPSAKADTSWYPGVDPLQVGLAEDAQRRQVRLGVRAVRHRVDENADDVTVRPRTRTAAPALRPEAR